MKTVFHSRSEKETRTWSLRFAKTLKSGDVVCIAGEFGAGKTRMVKAICEFFGIDPNTVTSPSFTLIHEYAGKEKIVHLDMYRLGSDTEFEMLDIDYYLGQKVILLVEWADKVRHLLPKGAKVITLEITGDKTRTITVI